MSSAGIESVGYARRVPEGWVGRTLPAGAEHMIQRVSDAPCRYVAHGRWCAGQVAPAQWLAVCQGFVLTCHNTTPQCSLAHTGLRGAEVRSRVNSGPNTIRSANFHDITLSYELTCRWPAFGVPKIIGDKGDCCLGYAYPPKKNSPPQAAQTHGDGVFATGRGGNALCRGQNVTLPSGLRRPGRPRA